MAVSPASEVNEHKEETEMTTAFEIDLDSNSLSFGNVANGQITDLNAEIKLRSEMGFEPIGGTIKGSFIGEIKNAKTIPITIPHKTNEAGGFNVIVIGSGGTGGYLIRDLARFIYALREKGDSRIFNIKLVDADTVEEKNVLRQNFTPRDLGKYKAEVMAKRYSNAFGLEIAAVTKMILSSTDLTELFDYNDVAGNPMVNIVLGCVDNNAARRVVEGVVNNNGNLYWIDSGNETKSGQVVCGYGRKPYHYNYGTPERNSQYWMPNVANLYPEILNSEEDDIEDSGVSCAERTLVDTQNIFVNMTAAGHVLGYVRQIIMGEAITINKIEFNIKGVTEVQYLTDAYLRSEQDKVRN